ncbi:MAG: hypothetical protein ACT4QF_04195 [Sporichthyaceae bacterium]
MTPRFLALAAAVLAAATLAGCSSDSTAVEAANGAPPPTEASPAASPESEEAPALPNGWRWESWLDAQVAVPGDWTWINGSQRAGQWCVGNAGKGYQRPRGIGRPGVSTMVGCGRGAKGAPNPGTSIETNGVFAAFTGSESAQPGIEGDRLTVVQGDVALLVQAAPELRDRIAATLHRIEVDANGCPIADEVARTPSAEPQPAIALGTLTGVRSVAVCRYGLRSEDPADHDRPSLLSSVRILGKSAGRALAGLAKAPAAGGQNRPDGCQTKYGREMLVLRIVSAAGPSRVHVRYSGCDHNAVDDGVSPRRLTPALHPFFSGGNRPNSFSGGPGKAEAIWAKDAKGRIAKPTPPPSDDDRPQG